MKPSPEIWPPPPVRSPPEAQADDDDWLAANDFLVRVSWRDYAAVIAVVFWLLLSCIALAAHHRLPIGVVKNIWHFYRTIF